jgi:hypothetical protein
VASTPTSITGAIGNFLSGAAQDKAKQAAANGPLLSYSYEIKSMEIKPISDSLFKPDAGYQQVQ